MKKTGHGKCAICGDEVTRSQVNHGDGSKLSDGKYYHYDCISMRDEKEQQELEEKEYEAAHPQN